MDRKKKAGVATLISDKIDFKTKAKLVSNKTDFKNKKVQRRSLHNT